MKAKFWVLRAFVLAFIPLLTASCGGGGGGEEAPQQPPPVAAEPVPEVTITGVDPEGMKPATPTSLETKFMVTGGSPGPVEMTVRATCTMSTSTVVIDEKVRLETLSALQVSVALTQYRLEGYSCVGTIDLTVWVRGRAVHARTRDFSFGVKRSVLRYKDIVYGITSGPSGYVRFASADGTCATITPEFAVNKSRFQGGFSPMIRLWLHSTPLPSGLVPSSGIMYQEGGSRHGTVLDPVANLVLDPTEGDGEFPYMGSDIFGTGRDAGWVDIGTDHANPAWVFAAETSNYVIFVDDDGRTPRCFDLRSGATVPLRSPNVESIYTAFVRLSN